jgi:hypothetical protein
MNTGNALGRGEGENVKYGCDVNFNQNVPILAQINRNMGVSQNPSF